MSEFCPFAKSAQTPCVKRDGEVAWAIGASEQPICVGCERGPVTLRVPYPDDWAAAVALYKATRRD